MSHVCRYLSSEKAYRRLVVFVNSHLYLAFFSSSTELDSISEMFIAQVWPQLPQLPLRQRQLPSSAQNAFPGQGHPASGLEARVKSCP